MSDPMREAAQMLAYLWDAETVNGTAVRDLFYDDDPLTHDVPRVIAAAHAAPPPEAGLRERVEKWHTALVLANCPDPDRYPADAEAHLAALDDITSWLALPVSPADPDMEERLAGDLHASGTCDSPRADVHNTHMGGNEIVNACQWQAARLIAQGWRR